MGEVMKEAAFSLAEAKFTTGDFNQVVLQNVTKAQIKIRSKKDNVAGKFYSNNQVITFNTCFSSCHLRKTDECIQRIKKKKTTFIAI